MDHKPDIGFIDTHSEGDGSTDYLNILAEELILAFGPQFAVEPRMVSHRFYSVGH